MDVKKRIGVTLIAITVIVILAATVSLFANGTNSKSDGHDKVIEFAGILSTEAEKSNQTGKDGIVPEFERIVESEMLLGKSKHQAIQEARESIIEKEALYHMAIERGVDVSDKALDQFLQKFISESKLADNFDEIQSACIEAGTTFEETVYMNKENYRKDMAINELEDNLEMDQDSNALDQLTEQAKIQYFKSNSYSELELKLDTAKKLILENKTTINDLKR